MDRRNFIKSGFSAAVTGLLATNTLPTLAENTAHRVIRKKRKPGVKYCRAITMWDFSWLERRWPGAGFEDWDKALDELVERGYNAVRIEAYPHLVSADAKKEWTLNEVWNQQVWGSPDLNKVCVQPNLNQFIHKCKERDVKVGLSSWYRQDTENVYQTITTPENMASIWVDTLRSIQSEGLLDNILYVDLCNEWPGDLWAPFFKKLYPDVQWGQWYKEASLRWMKTSISLLRQEFPDMPFLFSFDCQDVRKYNELDTSFLDMYEHHVWMVHQNNNEFYKQVGYKDGRFAPQAYKNVVKNAEPLYHQKPDYWQKLLTDKIELLGECARKNNTPLCTTECWGIVDYKDWPLLHWDWVKELCELGVKTALSTNSWIAIASSNFCSPQFVGMWRDIEWHRRLTNLITQTPVNEAFYKNPNALKVIYRL